MSGLNIIKNSLIVYIVLGIVGAVGTNSGLGIVLATDMPVVAVESNSMVPTFYQGDILVLQGVPPEELKIGDIIVFSPSQGATPVVHRIIKINDDGSFQTKGDANAGQLPFEKKILPEQIHGRVVFIIPYLGWIKLAFSRYVLPNIIWIFIAAVILGALWFGDGARKLLK